MPPHQFFSNIPAEGQLSVTDHSPEPLQIAITPQVFTRIALLGEHRITLVHSSSRRSFTVEDLIAEQSPIPEIKQSKLPDFYHTHRVEIEVPPSVGEIAIHFTGQVRNQTFHLMVRDPGHLNNWHIFCFDASVIEQLLGTKEDR
jgi:hypothetical protein